MVKRCFLFFLEGVGWPGKVEPLLFLERGGGEGEGEQV